MNTTNPQPAPEPPKTVRLEILQVTAFQDSSGRHIDAKPGQVVEATPASAKRLLELNKAKPAKPA